MPCRHCTYPIGDYFFFRVQPTLVFSESLPACGFPDLIIQELLSLKIIWLLFKQGATRGKSSNLKIFRSSRQKQKPCWQLNASLRTSELHSTCNHVNSEYSSLSQKCLPCMCYTENAVAVSACSTASLARWTTGSTTQITLLMDLGWRLSALELITTFL